jgi:hypothetical protein
MNSILKVFKVHFKPEKTKKAKKNRNVMQNNEGKTCLILSRSKKKLKIGE